jgi:hypothetical protein
LLRRILVTLLFIAVFSVHSSNGQQPNQNPAATTSNRCSAAEYRQMDFWVGDWDVYDDKSQLQGRNLIEKVLGGCALQEYYIDVSGLRATSFSMYDTSRKVWNQTYISTFGTLLSVEGYLQGKSMIMIGTHLTNEGRVALHRMIWTPNDDGTAYQLWNYSKDGGKTWETIYEGFLRKAKKPFPRAEFN